MPTFLLNMVAEAGTTTTVLGSIVTTEMLSGITDEMVGVLPVAFPVLVTAVGIRKAISFITGLLHSM